jgi:Tfp pilus assembly protein PilO
MTRTRRKLATRILEATALGLVVINLVLYFALVRPVRNVRAAAESQYTAVRDRVREGKARVARLEKFKAGVPDAETQLEEFLKDHVPERRQGFSRAARMVRKVSEDSKVRLTGVSYKLVARGDDPLARLGLEIAVEGTVANLLNFTHALETSGDFLTLREFSFEPGESRAIAMRVGADLYLKP